MALVTIEKDGIRSTVNETSPGLFGKLGYTYISGGSPERTLTPLNPPQEKTLTPAPIQIQEKTIPTSTGDLSTFADVLSKATDLARLKRNRMTLELLGERFDPSLQPASGFAGILGDIQRAGQRFTAEEIERQITPKGEPFTLGKDQIRFDEFNNIVARGVSSTTGEGGFVDFDVDTSVGALAAIAQNLSPQFSSKFQQDAFNTNVQRLVQAGDEQQLADFIFNQAISTIKDSETRKKAFSQFKIIKKLDMLETQLALYKAGGGDTGIWRGRKEAIMSKIGRVDDPELKALAIAMQDTMDGLSRDRTGAVLSDDEIVFYTQLLPSEFKSAKLNQAVIDGLKNSMVTDLNSILSFQLTGSGFSTIEPYLGGDKFDIPDAEILKETEDLEFLDEPTATSFFSEVRGSISDIYTNFFKN